MNTLLCAIGRMENEYIREWVEYNKNVGFTNICLFDNNHDGEEDFRDVIGDYIDSGFVVLKDYRNRIVCQLDAYTECYVEYGNHYDWIAFFDCDEFIEVKLNNNINEYLSHDRFNNFCVIKLNWLVYGDNDMLYNDGRPVLERFKYPNPIYRDENNVTIKSIIRGGQKIDTGNGGFKFLNPHTTDLFPCCNNNGEEIYFYDSLVKINYDKALLRHYTTKTAREYCDKIKRKFPDISYYTRTDEYQITNFFFSINEVTPEKVQIFKDVLNVDVSYLLK